MEISVAGYKISLVTLLLIVLVTFVLTGHTLCGCCEVKGFDGFKEGLTGKPKVGKGPVGSPAVGEPAQPRKTK